MDAQGRRTGLSFTRVAVAASLMCAGAFVARGTAQDDAAQDRSTLSGVYTSAQATRGEETYMNVCVACHPPATYTGAAFKTSWGGRPLSDLFDALVEKMPKNDPGSLSPAEYGQVVAYLLKINGNPAGKTELPAEAEPLKQIRIETPEMRSDKH
jgi:mono/diheme cytochrome c family protein